MDWLHFGYRHNIHKGDAVARDGTFIQTRYQYSAFFIRWEEDLRTIRGVSPLSETHPQFRGLSHIRLGLGIVSFFPID